MTLQDKNYGDLIIFSYALLTVRYQIIESLSTGRHRTVSKKQPPDFIAVDPDVYPCSVRDKF